MRIGRQFATAGGVLLGIAFYASVRTSQALTPIRDTPEAIEDAAKMRLLVSLSLTMCFVGIINAMFMSVTERYREIGTFKCLGATDTFVVKVFFLEALLIGLAASTSGGALGILVMLAVKVITGILPSIENLTTILPQVLGSSILIGTLLTVVAAILPSMQAARMPAAAALRVEI